MTESFPLDAIWPFSLSGPVFLFVLAGLVIPLCLLGSWIWIRRTPAGAATQVPTEDPVLLAALRGGPEEALRVTTVSLLDRGWLTLRSVASRDDGLVSVTDRLATELRRPIERRIFEQCKAATSASDLAQELADHPYVTSFETELAERGWKAPSARRYQALVAAGGLVTLLVLARLAQAMSHGRHNIGFLLLLWLLTLFFIWRIVRKSPLTFQGERVLQDARRLLEPLRRRAAQIPKGGSTSELALLIGAFGLGAAPEHFRPQSAFPGSYRRRVKRGSDSTGVAFASDSCGSSCGSSSSGSDSGASSCGSSSCGGGGCGGCGGGD